MIPHYHFNFYLLTTTETEHLVNVCWPFVFVHLRTICSYPLHAFSSGYFFLIDL